MSISIETKVKFYFRLVEVTDSFSNISSLDLKIFNIEMCSFFHLLNTSYLPGIELGGGK